MRAIRAGDQNTPTVAPRELQAYNEDQEHAENSIQQLHATSGSISAIVPVEAVLCWVSQDLMTDKNLGVDRVLPKVDNITDARQNTKEARQQIVKEYGLPNVHIITDDKENRTGRCLVLQENLVLFQQRELMFWTQVFKVDNNKKNMLVLKGLQVWRRSENRSYRWKNPSALNRMLSQA